MVVAFIAFYAPEFVSEGIDWVGAGGNGDAVDKKVVKVDTEVVRSAVVRVYRTGVVDDGERVFQDKDVSTRVFENVS